MSVNRKLRWEQKCIFCILPGFLGTAVFALIPFFRMIYYAFVKSQFRREFVFFRNFIRVWENDYFRLALKNSIFLLLRDVPVLMLTAVTLSILLHFFFKKDAWVKAAFILPMVIPTAGIVPVWKTIFGDLTGTLPVDLLFLWKNIGICMILMTAALEKIPDSVYDAAKTDGAGFIKTQLFITIPMTAPALFFGTLLSVMNSYKIFKESFLYYGTSYPPDYAYTLQYYMNNHFLKLDYQSLAASSIYNTLLSLLLILTGLRLTKKFQYTE